jgi:hypothetical protein
VFLHTSEWASFDLFRALDEHELSRCIRRMRINEYKAGDRIIAKDTVGTTVRF